MNTKNSAESTPPLRTFVIAASPFLAGFDIDSTLNSTNATNYYNQGYRFCFRYLSLETPEASGDLSNAEAKNILGANLALMPVQHVNYSGWQPTADLGKTHGEAAAANALAVGFPPGTTVWMDLEGVSLESTSSDVIAYCTQWYAAVLEKGYVPGIYIGYQCGLDAEELSTLPFANYWQSASNVPVPRRGYQMVQGGQDGSIDPDTTYDDHEGGQAIWVASSMPIYPTLRPNPGVYSDAVKALQTALNVTGAGIHADGYFGDSTQNAVTSFQKTASLPADGTCGAQTWSALIAAAAAPPQTNTAALLPYAPVLSMTTSVHLVFGQCLGLIPTPDPEKLANELADLLGAEPQPDAGTITPGDLSSIANVLQALLVAAPAGTPLYERLSALHSFYVQQVQSPSTYPRIWVVSAAMSQIGTVNSKKNPPVGADRLNEYFMTAFGNATNFDQNPTLSWCALFASWANKAAGLWSGNWIMGKGISAVPGTLNMTGTTPLPGDMGYLDAFQHTFVISSVYTKDGTTRVQSVDGNSYDAGTGASGIIQMRDRALSEIAGIFRTAGLNIAGPPVNTGVQIVAAV